MVKNISLLNSVTGWLALSVIGLAGCIVQTSDAVNGNAVHAITLSAPTAAERSTLRNNSKGTPLQVGFGREIPNAQRRVALRDLKWNAIDGGYAATISVRSTGARSLRVGMRLNRNIAGLECGFRGAGSVSASEIAIGGDPYWSPVIAGDTLWIELKATTLPAADVVLELPMVSHIS